MSMIIKMLDKLNEDGIPMERVVLGAAVDTPDFIRELRRREQEESDRAFNDLIKVQAAVLREGEKMTAYAIPKAPASAPAPALNEDQRKVLRVFENLIPKIVAAMRGISEHFGPPDHMKFDLPGARVDIHRSGKNFQITYTSWR